MKAKPEATYCSIKTFLALHFGVEKGKSVSCDMEMKTRMGLPRPDQRWHRGFAEENLCQNRFNLYEAEDDFERGESESHVLPGRLLACAPPRQSGLPQRSPNLVPPAAAGPFSTSAQNIENPVRAAKSAAKPDVSN